MTSTDKLKILEGKGLWAEHFKCLIQLGKSTLVETMIGSKFKSTMSSKSVISSRNLPSKHGHDRNDFISAESNVDVL